MRERKDPVASCSQEVLQVVFVPTNGTMDRRDADASSSSSKEDLIVFLNDEPSTPKFTTGKQYYRSPCRFTPTTTPQKKPT